jgi:excisionase family DNA binding protein
MANMCDEDTTLDRVIETIECNWLTTKQAARYLNLSVATVKYHVKEGNLIPEKPGHDLLFPRGELERFEREKRNPGRPKDSTTTE